MPAHNSLADSLKTSGQQFDVLIHPVSDSVLETASCANIPAKNLARSVLYSDIEGPMLLIFPATHCIDIDKLNRQLQRQLIPASTEKTLLLFPGCHIDALPPFSSEIAIPCIIDNALADEEVIYFAPGRNDQLIRMSVDDFHTLLERALHGLSFCHILPGYKLTAISEKAPVNKDKVNNLQSRLSALQSLPGIPDTARELLKLVNRTNSRIQDLVWVVERDPMLTAQMMFQASSAFYGYRGKIANLESAIFRVYGYDRGLNMALGLATSHTFNGPRGGRLGQANLYRDAVFCAELAETLSRKMPHSHRPAKGSAYLTGLLHNIGYTLIAHLFSDEYASLNKQLTQNPKLSCWDTVTEQYGINPGNIGAWLMEAWNMPAEICVAQCEQRNTQYRGNAAIQAQLVLLANRLLHQYNIGSADSHELPEEVLQQLGIDADTALEKVSALMEHQTEIDNMVQQMIA